MAQQIPTHLVPVTVFVRAQGLDRRDAVNVAEAALSEALHETTLTTRTHAGHQRTATVVTVTELGAALRAGILTVVPTAPEGSGRVAA